VQGGVFEDLRSESVAKLREIDFDGYAVGGLAVGEGQEVMFKVLDYTMVQMATAKPRYLMGVGKPDDIVGAVVRGIDMFDCVLPSRSGRTGQAFTRRGALNMKNARHVDDPRPIDDQCGCDACQNYSRAYMAHLIRSNEVLGAMLLTEHNLTYYQDLMSGLRDAISARQLTEFVDKFHALRAEGDIEEI
jgi:queuine tRNA-ribosyltransferase